MLFDGKTSVILVSVLAFAIMYSVFDSEGGDLTGNQVLRGCFDSDAAAGPPWWYETNGYCVDAYAPMGVTGTHVDSCLDSNTIVE